LASLDQITELAAESAIAHYDWPHRGPAPIGYVKGMAVCYARVYCRYQSGDAAVLCMAAADGNAPNTDALSWYHDEFAAQGMSNTINGIDTLRHLFVLLMGLGMRESSGRYCEGRDTSADNTSGDTAEAGTFQVSYNACRAGLLRGLYESYQGKTDFLPIFREGVIPTPSDLINWGTGEGVSFQQLTKSCPLFAAEFAALALRMERTHWGPINRRDAELRPECDALFLAVENAVAASDLCPLLVG